MVLFLAAATLAQTSLLRQIVTNHDAQNGYEDYLRAAEIVYRPDFELYRRGFPNIKDAPMPEGVSLQDDDLAVKRNMVSRYGAALDILKIGNSKPVRDPREQFTVESKFPEFVGFKDLAFLEAAAAHLAFADGHPSVGTTNFLDGFTFCDKLSVGALTSRLVSIGANAILVRELNRHLWDLALDDAVRIKSFANDALAQTNAATALERELRISTVVLEGAIDSPQNGSNAIIGESLAGEIEKLTPIERQQVKQQAYDLISREAGDAILALRGPETGWMRAAESMDLRPGDTLADRIFEALWGRALFGQVVNYEARRRVMLRLIRLSAMAVEYRWHTGKVPARLSDFASSEDQIDPITGQPFQFRKDGPWFKITAAGFGNFGTISLGPSAVPDPELRRKANP